MFESVGHAPCSLEADLVVSDHLLATAGEEGDDAGVVGEGDAERAGGIKGALGFFALGQFAVRKKNRT